MTPSPPLPPGASRPLPRVDPTARHGAVHGALSTLARSRAGLWLGPRLAARVDPFLMRFSGGRVALTGFLPVATLETIGARSGITRTAAVVYFSDGDDVVLVASSFGRDRHPAWYHNLVAHPDTTLTVGRRTARFQAVEVTDADEHARLFTLAESVYGGYADYRTRTAAVGRRIPIMRLRPTGG